MKVNEFEIDVAAVEVGAWVGAKYDTPIPDMGDLCIKTRGAENAEWRRIQNKLIAAVPRQRRQEGLLPEDQDRIVAVCLREAGVLDWDGIDDADGKPLPYSKAQANVFLTEPKFKRLFRAMQYAANIVGDRSAVEQTADVKN